jgi:hypothetical protein
MAYAFGRMLGKKDKRKGRKKTCYEGCKAKRKKTKDLP